MSIIDEIGTGGAMGAGIGTLQLTYNQIGSGGATGAGNQVNGAIVLSGENEFYLVTEDGDEIVLEDSAGVTYFDNSYVIHNVIGSGGALGDGQGTSHVISSGGNNYDEVGSGGAVGGGIGRVGFTPGPLSQLKIRCRRHQESLIACRKAYIPVITQCNQKITVKVLEGICNRLTDRRR